MNMDGVWINRSVSSSQDGMGNLKITEKGLRLEGDSEFLQPLYAKEVQSKPVRSIDTLSHRAQAAVQDDGTTWRLVSADLSQCNKILLFL